MKALQIRQVRIRACYIGVNTRQDLQLRVVLIAFDVEPKAFLREIWRLEHESVPIEKCFRFRLHLELHLSSPIALIIVTLLRVQLMAFEEAVD